MSWKTMAFCAMCKPYFKQSTYNRWAKTTWQFGEYPNFSTVWLRSPLDNLVSSLIFCTVWPPSPHPFYGNAPAQKGQCLSSRTYAVQTNTRFACHRWRWNADEILTPIIQADYGFDVPTPLNLSRTEVFLVLLCLGCHSLFWICE